MARIGRATLIFCFLGVASPAPAQVATTPALFLETVRDPGNPDVPPTARALALGGMRFESGGADVAVASPASLMLGAGADVIVSGGLFFYARDELIQTPNRFPPRKPERTLSPRSRAFPFFAAAAARKSRWALAAFYDSSARFEHRFDTQKSNISSTALQGSFVAEDGTGDASVSQAVSRVGGAVAAGPSSRRGAIGVGVYAVRLAYDVSAHVHVDGSRRFAGGPITFFTEEHDNRVTFRGWGPAVALSAMVKPLSHVVVAARWERTPEFGATARS